ncbi:hypothetical protein AUR64_06010 [Haloprofundus marisrubri]|uniref:DUF4352 domain-containing protein n=1 Tax=Haloprofundus marisrubri TaxID=1514971 RepID=A0A0W1RCA1_9EURY|nr:hypothetical protein [Haloprofundus marisrubri]KTG10745.1 hypothetical protein AUR64_06010 [Haloprofundus marisrubri]
MPSRRAVVAAGLVALSGCSTASTDEGETGENQQTESRSNRTTTDGEAESATPMQGFHIGETADIDGASVTVSAITAQESVYVTRIDSMDVRTAHSARFVFASVTVETESPFPVSRFSLVDADGHTSEYTDFGNRPGYSVVPDSGPHQLLDADGPDGWVGFSVPAPYDGDELRLTATAGDETATWNPPDELAETLRAPLPTFEYAEVEIAETAPLDGFFEMSVTVRNTSETDGTFRGSPNVDEMLYGPFSLSVPAGSEKRWTTEMRTSEYADEDGDEIELSLYSPLEAVERTVTAEASESSAAPTPSKLRSN